MKMLYVFIPTKMEFFDKLELNVSLNWSLIEHADKMCESIIDANDDRMNFEDELRNSFELESSHITKDITDKLTQYDGLNIEKIYSIMMENKYPLKRTRHVCVKNTFDEILHISRIFQHAYIFRKHMWM